MTPRKRGRPPKPVADTVPVNLTLRCTPEQRARWEAAAAAEGARQGRPLALTSWLRQVADERAGAR